jgi:hypothetical protein
LGRDPIRDHNDFPTPQVRPRRSGVPPRNATQQALDDEREEKYGREQKEEVHLVEPDIDPLSDFDNTSFGPIQRVMRNFVPRMFGTPQPPVNPTSPLAPHHGAPDPFEQDGFNDIEQSEFVFDGIRIDDEAPNIANVPFPPDGM